MARRSDHTRPQLKEMAIKYAIEIISTEGIHKFSARSVAKKMGYTVGTLYNIFEDCHDIIMQVNATTLDALYNFMSYVAERKMSPKERLTEICLRYWEYAEQNQARWSALFESEIRGRPQDLPQWYAEKVEKIFTLVHNQIVQIMPSADEKTLSRLKKTVWGNIHGICQLHFRSQLNHPDKSQQDTIPELIQSVIDTYFPEKA